MIKNINTGKGITVQNGYASWPNFYNNSTSSGNTLVGQVRYNGSSQNFEVYDGATWLNMSPANVMIELAPDVQAVVTWAQTKMAEELNWAQLALTSPTLKDALEALNQAQQQVRIIAALVKT